MTKAFNSKCSDVSIIGFEGFLFFIFFLSFFYNFLSNSSLVLLGFSDFNMLGEKFFDVSCLVIFNVNIMFSFFWNFIT